MKRFLLLVVAVLLLVGCGLNNAAQENLSNAANLGWDEGVAAIFSFEEGSSIWGSFGEANCEVKPELNTNQAQVTCILDIDKEESLKLGSDSPITLHLGGLLMAADDKFTFDTAESFKGRGNSRISIANLFNEDNDNYDPNFPSIVTLTTELDSVRVPVEIVGIAIPEGLKELSAFSDNKNLTHTFKTFAGTGQLIPGTSFVSYSYVAETEDGQQFMGGGILNAGEDLSKKLGSDNTLAFTEHAGSYLFASPKSMIDGPNNPQLGNFEVQDLMFTNGAGGNTIISAEGLGFNIGMPARKK